MSLVNNAKALIGGIVCDEVPQEAIIIGVEHNSHGVLIIKSLNRLQIEPKQRIKSIIQGFRTYSGGTTHLEFIDATCFFMREKMGIEKKPACWETFFRFKCVKEM